ncbi:MAG: hypothetical protein SF066_08660 [Thermoanaerobaculia bacterium]|nr:hypothetical protein [Thermoanaerobaculia bacterium]
MTDDQVLARAEGLARRLSQKGVRDNQLNLALTHLKRGRDLAATLKLLATLPGTPMAQRANKTQDQLRDMQRLVSEEVKTVRTWQDAAAILGWARRLMPSFREETETYGAGPAGGGGRNRPDRGRGGWR